MPRIVAELSGLEFGVGETEAKTCCGSYSKLVVRVEPSPSTDATAL
jgi:hypothetical protein